MYILGLTGPIASGKSFVEEAFTSLGASVIDADKVVHNIYEIDTEIANKIATELGENVTTKSHTIDRDKLREAVKKHPQNLAKLEAIIYPEMRNKVSERLHALKEQQVKLCVLSVPMMFESPLRDFCQSIACCSAPESIRKERALLRENVTEEILNVIMSKQKSTEEYCELSHHIIPTDSTKKATTEAVKQLHKTLLESIK